MSHIITSSGWKPILEEQEEQLDEATKNHHLIIPKEYDTPETMERARKLVAKLYPDTETHRYVLKRWFAGPRKKNWIGRGASTSGTTRKKDRVGHKLEIRKVHKKAARQRTAEYRGKLSQPGEEHYYGHNWGDSVRYIHPAELGLKFHKDLPPDQRPARFTQKYGDVKESKKTGSEQDIKHYAQRIIQDVLPDLEDALRGDDESSIYHAVLDHLNDRVYDEYPGAPDALRNKIVKQVVDNHVHDDRHEVRARERNRKAKEKRAAAAKLRPPRVPKPKKVKEPAHDQAGFKTKLGSHKPPVWAGFHKAAKSEPVKVRAGVGSYGKAKYAVSEEDHSPLRKIVSIVEARRNPAAQGLVDFHNSNTRAALRDAKEKDKKKPTKKK